MPTETLKAKADRLLTAGNVHLLKVAPDVVVARVHGDSGVWDVRLQDGRWTCTCPAGPHPCSHYAAVALVTLPPWVRRRSA
jgi:uncharacterized Zn finger protein